MMLPAASENVLMAVQGCAVDRLCPTVGTITRLTSPLLSTDEVAEIVRLLADDGYVRIEYGVISTAPAYFLTDRGSAEASRVVAQDEEERS